MLLLPILFLHITTMFMAVAVSYGGVVFFLIALRNRNAAGVVTMSRSAKTTARAIPVLYGLGGIFGLLTAIISGANLLAPWLIIAYVLFVVLTVVGAGFTGPSIERIGALVAAAPEGTYPPEVDAMRSRFYWVEVVDFALLFVIIFDMVVKPFS